MSSFIRRDSVHWHDDVPGARWFPADLHVHTLDDHPNPSLQRPTGVVGIAQDEDTQTAYAKALLKQAVENGIQVLGLTPHAVCSGDTDESSATWRIVDIWNQEEDDDGVPFRDKIYAVFPGFEPNLADGADGLHLLFLFDPEIGRQDYVAACTGIMDAISPYDGNSLRISPKRAKEAFGSIAEMQKRLRADWRSVCLAAHAFGERGLFSLKSQVLQHFPSAHIRGLQLKDDWLPEDAFADKSWLREGMRKYHHAFFYASDAYSVSDIGRRYTFIKLASPRIESLRQAFLASDSRIRIPYVKDDEGHLEIDPVAPEAIPSSRPWISHVQVSGGTSFFAGRDVENEVDHEQTFSLSPDLTCVIGGRMSGKSTFLDGLRVHFDHALPTDKSLRMAVEERGRDVFLSGNPGIDINLHSPVAASSPISDQWPAHFFTQRELQRVVDDQDMRRDILHRLIPGETKGLVGRESQLVKLDERLAVLFDGVRARRAALAAAQDAMAEIDKADHELERFEDAGIESLRTAQADQGKIENLSGTIERLDGDLVDPDEIAEALAADVSDDDVKATLDKCHPRLGFQGVVQLFISTVERQKKILDALGGAITSARPVANEKVQNARASVQRVLVEAGGKADELNQFDALSAIAAKREQAARSLAVASKDYRQHLRLFAEAHQTRTRLIQEQREAMMCVALTVLGRFDGNIRITCQEGGLVEPLEEWLLGLRAAHVTRWWNSVKGAGLHPDALRDAIRCRSLQSLGMSEQVEETFLKLMDANKRMELASLRSEDRHSIELRIGPAADDYRELVRLSGGAQVSVLLSLILETDDTTPLIVDQPEDETDKNYLLEVLLPVLRRLKGRRQIIFATHDANIVVNGDADQVIVLEADAHSGRIVHQGAIEDPSVKDAIVCVLDGGPEAFKLRKVKYGF